MKLQDLTLKQQEIVRISLDLFQRKGYVGSSVRDIAEELNIKAASLYSHITSKEEIFEWICADLTERFRLAAEKVDEMGGSPKEHFMNLLKAHLTEVFRNVTQYNVFFTNIYNYEIELVNKTKYLTNVMEYIAYLEQVITKYLDTLDIPEIIEKDVVIKFSTSVINSFYRWKPEEEFDLERDAQFLHHMLVYGVSGK